MKFDRTRWPRRRALRAAAPLAALLALTVIASPALAATPCTSPPAVFPVSQIVPGMTGTGRTVISGTTPLDFDVEVLGVLPDGIAVGIDLILVKITGPQSFLDQAHGFAAGMSGSPVFIQGQLAGALSYGLALADHTVGGMTPAQPMVDLFSYPTGPPPSAPPRLARRIVLPPRLAAAVAHATRLPLTASTVTAVPLVTPVGVSGLSDRRLEQLQAMLDQRHLPFLVYRSGAASGPGTTLVPTPLQGGGNFVSVESYGDVTAAGIGTATAECGDLTVAFGHPLFFYPAGTTTLGMNDGNILAVLDDPSGIEGPFKIGTIGPAHGMVTQDRFVGELGVAGSLPPLVPVQTQFSNPDLARSRTGETDIAYQQDFGVPFIALFHVVSNLDVVFDRVGEGTLRMDWSILGLRADGSPWEVDRSNMYHSEFDATEGVFQLFRQLNRLASNDFEDVTFTSIRASGFITQADLEAELVGLRSSSSLQPAMKQRDVLKVKPGRTIHLEAILQPAKGAQTRTVDFSLRVPRSARSGAIVVVRGGGKAPDGGGGPLLLRPAARPKPGGGNTPTSFDELLDKLNSGTPSYDFVVRLSTRRTTRTSLVGTDTIVFGKLRLSLEVPG